MEVLWKSVKGFRSYRTPQTPFPILNVHRPYNRPYFVEIFQISISSATAGKNFI